MPSSRERASEHDGSTYWATSWNHHFTCVSENRFGLDRCAPSIWNLNNALEEEEYEAYDFILCFYNLNIQWESTPQDCEAARDPRRRHRATCMATVPTTSSSARLARRRGPRRAPAHGVAVACDDLRRLRDGVEARVAEALHEAL